MLACCCTSPGAEGNLLESTDPVVVEKLSAMSPASAPTSPKEEEKAEAEKLVVELEKEAEARKPFDCVVEAREIFLIDNSSLKADTQRLALRRSKDLQDTVPPTEQFGPAWGDYVVELVELEGGWYKYGNFYLPKMLNNCQVVTPTKDSWGMTVEMWPEFLQVIDIKEKGRVINYNTQQGEENQELRPGSLHKIICVGDIITQIGASEKTQTVSEMRNVLQDQSLRQIRLSVTPPIRIKAKVIRAGATPWGLSVNTIDNKKGLVVCGAPKVSSPSYVYNAQVPEEMMIQPRDIILDINGKTSSQDLMAVLKDTSCLEIELTLLRKTNQERFC